MENKYQIYVQNYFAAYKEATEIKFYEEGDRQQIVDSLMERPVLINKPRTYVDLNFSGPSFDGFKRFTYFDAGVTILKGDITQVVVPDEYTYSQMKCKPATSPTSFFKHIHKFPEFVKSEKKGSIVDLYERYSTKKIVGKAFCASLPVIGNLDLLYLIFNGLISPVQIEHVNNNLQKAALHPDAELWCKHEAVIQFHANFPSISDINDEGIIRTLQNEVLGRMSWVENKLLQAKAFFECQKAECATDLLARIDRTINERKLTIAENEQNDLNAKRVQELLNDF